MPKISHPLSESERILFHANYKYMWDKISTTYFAVLRSKTPPSAKIDEKKLPSYAICAKCNNDESYAPSRATIAKIVDFYNSQIRPLLRFTNLHMKGSRIPITFVIAVLLFLILVLSAPTVVIILL